ncbi:MAG: dihydrodipicolinate synthase family protein [Bryobacterales bacterium]|nr:dihydrodipicolinate synthase family protein [Bryobacteraceae bacterium]MDW8131969.1 dihydrodipicolinate synthase family protein [Bryobacterales bacterium]
MSTHAAAALGGVNVAALTPRQRGETRVDPGAMVPLLEFLAGSGVQGIVVMGTTGEFAHFDCEERRRFVEQAVRSSRLPVAVCVAHATLDGALSLARAAAGAGAAALLIMPPYFFRYRQPEVKEFLLRFAAELKGAAPIYLYNIPFFTNELAAETAIELLSTGLFAGIKDSSGRWENFVKLRAARQRCGFRLLVGNDVLFAPARAAGADGVISGCACAIPELLVALDRVIVSGDAGGRDRLDARLHEFIAWADSFPTPVAIREALSVRGFRTGPHAVPLSPEQQRRLAQFRTWFAEWLPQVLEECSHA